MSDINKNEVGDTPDRAIPVVLTGVNGDEYPAGDYYMNLDRHQDVSFDPELDAYADDVADQIETQLQKRDVAVATKRTAIPAFWFTVIVTGANQIFGWQVTLDELLPWTPALLIGYGVIYRAARWAEARFPTLGKIVFGTGETPQYDPTHLEAG